MSALQRPDLHSIFNGEFLELNQLPSPQSFSQLVQMRADIFTCSVSMRSHGIFPLSIYEKPHSLGNSLESESRSWTTEKSGSCFPQKLLGNRVPTEMGFLLSFDKLFCFLFLLCYPGGEEKDGWRQMLTHV